MRSGQLRHVITFERRPTTLNTLGHQTDNAWRVLASGIRAKVHELSGRELELARQQVAEVTIQVTTRYGGATTKDRITFGTRSFEIASRTGNERGTEFVYLCIERP